MIPPLDIFMIDKNGDLVWKGAAENFEVARLSVNALMATTRADYVIYSHKTGHKTTIKADGTILGPR